MMELYMQLDDAVKRVNRLCRYEFGEQFDENLLRQELEQICQIPNPLKKRCLGHWIHEEAKHNGKMYLSTACRCSECNYRVLYESEFCPECGAVMVGEYVEERK